LYIHKELTLADSKASQCTNPTRREPLVRACICGCVALGVSADRSTHLPLCLSLCMCDHVTHR
jgi:hypothetical protein